MENQNFSINNVPEQNFGEVASLYKWANEIGFSYEGREYGYNSNSGNTYLWSEWENYTLFISDFHGGEIEFCYTDMTDGEELILDEAEMKKAIGRPEHYNLSNSNEEITKYFNDWQEKKDIVKEYEAGEEEMN